MAGLSTANQCIYLRSAGGSANQVSREAHHELETPQNSELSIYWERGFALLGLKKVSHLTLRHRYWPDLNQLATFRESCWSNARLILYSVDNSESAINLQPHLSVPATPGPALVRSLPSVLLNCRIDAVGLVSVSRDSHCNWSCMWQMQKLPSQCSQAIFQATTGKERELTGTVLRHSPLCQTPVGALIENLYLFDWSVIYLELDCHPGALQPSAFRRLWSLAAYACQSTWNASLTCFQCHCCEYVISFKWISNGTNLTDSILDVWFLWSSESKREGVL